MTHDDGRQSMVIGYLSDSVDLKNTVYASVQHCIIHIIADREFVLSYHIGM